jgi:hypothetical protein
MDNFPCSASAVWASYSPQEREERFKPLEGARAAREFLLLSCAWLTTGVCFEASIYVTGFTLHDAVSSVLTQCQDATLLCLSNDLAVRTDDFSYERSRSQRQFMIVT